MENIDFQAGHEFGGVYFPPLKPVDKACVDMDGVGECVYVRYEPGNGTRYEVVFSCYVTQDGGQVLMTIVNMGKSMIIASKMGLYSLDYMHEKLGLGLGDCYALIPLINRYLEEA